MSKLFILATAIEVVGVAVVGAGIGIELAMKADLGYMLVTGGALLIAGGGLIFNKVVRRR